MLMSNTLLLFFLFRWASILLTPCVFTTFQLLLICSSSGVTDSQCSGTGISLWSNTLALFSSLPHTITCRILLIPNVSLIIRNISFTAPCMLVIYCHSMNIIALANRYPVLEWKALWLHCHHLNQEPMKNLPPLLFPFDTLNAIGELMMGLFRTP